MRLDNEAEMREAQAALFSSVSSGGWILLNYVSSNTVHFSAGGEDGAEGAAEQLQDDQIQFILIRNGSDKDVFVKWIGPNVGDDEVQKNAGFDEDIQAFLQPYHVKITVTSKDNFNEDVTNA